MLTSAVTEVQDGEPCVTTQEHVVNVMLLTVMTFVVRLLRLLMKPIVPTDVMTSTVATAIETSGSVATRELSGSDTTRRLFYVMNIETSSRLVTPST